MMLLENQTWVSPIISSSFPICQPPSCLPWQAVHVPKTKGFIITPTSLALPTKKKKKRRKEEEEEKRQKGKKKRRDKILEQLPSRRAGISRSSPTEKWGFYGFFLFQSCRRLVVQTSLIDKPSWRTWWSLLRYCGFCWSEFRKQRCPSTADLSLWNRCALKLSPIGLNGLLPTKFSSIVQVCIRYGNSFVDFTF